MNAQEKPIRDEFALIDLLRRRVGRSGRVAVGIGDDAAVIRWPPDALVVTCDMLLDGVHFDLNEHSVEAVGRKAVACSLSDCAAMAARPVAATTSVAIPRRMPAEDVRRLAESMLEVAERYGCVLAGGDTTAWDGPLAIDVTMLAEVPPHRGPILRSGAKPGDAIFVSGRLGGSILGRHLTFEPRVDLAWRIAETGAVHAMIDISDGLAADLEHICRESGCGAELDADLLEQIISPEARLLASRTGRSPLQHALHDGEDFELLIAADEAGLEEFQRQGRLIRIGRMTAEAGIYLLTGTARQRIEPEGWKHKFGE